ncbi:MAG TPA: polysaccharide biosynthesis/export family protein [Vicinamibacterales bacterium]
MRLTHTILSALCSIGVSVAAFGGQDAALAPKADTGYRLGPKDSLTIVVFGHEELSGKFTVAGDGSLSVPLIAPIQAADRTVSEVQAELAERLGNGFLKSPRVSVEISQYVSQRVFVMGEVHTPGAVSLTGPMTLLEVLARSGSLTEQAGGDVVILRGADSGSSVPLVPGQENASELGRVSVQQLRRGTVATNLTLRDGDTVFVPRAENIYVLGLVNRPGPYVLESGLTVLRALSLAGGTTALGSIGRIRITRIVDGKRREMKAHIDDVLLPGDTITVGARRF